MHMDGVAEYYDGDAWHGIDELPFITRPRLYYKLFGEHDEQAGVTPVAPNRGIPEERSEMVDDARSIYQIHPARVGGDEVYEYFGVSWLTMDEFPEDERADREASDDWGKVFDLVAPYEDRYGEENVRLVVWFSR